MDRTIDVTFSNSLGTVSQSLATLLEEVKQLSQEALIHRLLINLRHCQGHQHGMVRAVGWQANPAHL